MKISVSSNFNNNVYNPNFQGGKVCFYTDFDHTFIPMNIDEFQVRAEDGNLNLDDYFKTFRKFVRRCRGNFQYTITTGRNLDEFTDTIQTAINHDVNIPISRCLITQSGQRKYVKLLPDFIGGKLNYYPAPLSWFKRIDVCDKDFDTTREVYKSLSKDNFVIAAGDGANDFRMLNPMTYLEYYMQKETGLPHKLDYELSKDGIKKFFENHGILERMFKNMPFVGIVVRRDKYPDRFTQLLNIFGSGEYHKLVVIEEGELLSGIKQAIDMLSEHTQVVMAEMRQTWHNEGKNLQLKKSVKNAAKML